ncbi:high affinity cAMP-specific and IBMX-insensitive 3',5'-cyclic phosphodiesterase 8B-like isoform X2 [Gigantopelta aegis]|uniref:high affinity cAMP-specific and IBMX-insensitive 3',5'-cyclic phosphodiesterase 8B-like isoform X2 n=1 Tax=Gigantopelta aegis TaxID=1735272 RepID=UPI001B887F70|nr:high affinity cAMP-specific and IBMX-insensitive 3',5'-cyclic phosphodiesterase 8B-like isoform X2 [Gigantopelta aegis]
MQSTEREVNYGPMRLRQRSMCILLVFAKDDGQSEGFWTAAGRQGHQCHVTRTPERAVECYTEKHHDVVIIDNRTSKHLDAEALCRCLRSTKRSEHTVIVAVTKKHTSEKEEPSICHLLKAGFNRRYTENVNIGACSNELLTLEHNDVRCQLKQRAGKALFTALNNVSDVVEITNEDNEIQYVNHAFERITGYSCEQAVGQDARELTKSDKNKPDLLEAISGQLRKGKYWEGTYHTRRKSGDTVPHHCRLAPILGPGGKIFQFVSVKTSPDHVKDLDCSQLPNGGIHTMPKRRESIARMHSVSIEAPITKVINLINTVQESCPLSVVQVLDKVVEILRTSELYSPYLTQQMQDEDPMTSDLVGGLVSQNMKRMSFHDISAPQHVPKLCSNLHSHIPSEYGVRLQIPEPIEAILENEACWDFDIINLENITIKRPLLYLGQKIFARFGACEFLGIPETVLTNWLQLIEATYHATNTYHNSTHAADVLHATAYFLQRDRSKQIFDQMDEVASLIAATVHDVDHPGRTNAFLVNASNDLAVLYNDLAVLESHHVALAFRLTEKDDSVNIFKCLSRENYRTMRQFVIDMVLATEMKQHFEHLSKFVNSINKNCLRYDDDVSVSSRSSRESTSVLTQLSTPENRLLIKRMVIKCADVSNPVRPLSLCIEWAKRIAEEYCQQTDEEKARGLPVVMPVFDRKTCSIPKSQISFIDVFISDMFDAWDFFCDVPELMKHLQINYQYWKEEEVLSTKTKVAQSSIDSESGAPATNDKVQQNSIEMETDADNT